MSFFQRDFVLRQVKYLTQLLEQIIFKKNQKQYVQALEQIHNAFQQLTKNHPKDFYELSLHETLNIFKRDENFEADLAIAVADLLLEEGEILQEKHFRQSQKCYLQALLLYKKARITSESPVPLNIQQKINRLKTVLKHSDQLDTIDKLLN
jgi:phosphoenolpyruvate carboxylase